MSDRNEHEVTRFYDDPNYSKYRNIQWLLNKEYTALEPKMFVKLITAVATGGLAWGLLYHLAKNI